MSFDEEEEDEGFTTLGGLVFSRFSEIPQDGSQPELDYRNLHIKVREISDRRVEWAEITKYELPDDDEDSSEEGASKPKKEKTQTEDEED